MQLTSLTISRASSWQTNAGQLSANATFEGPGGKIEVDLAPGFIVRVLSLIEEDAAQKAKRLAASVETALVDAIDTARLTEADKPLTIESDLPL